MFSLVETEAESILLPSESTIFDVQARYLESSGTVIFTQLHLISPHPAVRNTCLNIPIPDFFLKLQYLETSLGERIFL